MEMTIYYVVKKVKISIGKYLINNFYKYIEKTK